MAFIGDSPSNTLRVFAYVVFRAEQHKQASTLTGNQQEEISTDEACISSKKAHLI